MLWEDLGIHGPEAEMQMFNFRKRQKKQKTNIFDDGTNDRVQFNIKIDKDIKSAVKEMAK